MKAFRQQAYLYDDYFVNLLTDLVAKPHRHGVYQLMVSLDDKPCFVGPSLDNLRPGLLHLIGSNEPHAVDGRKGFQAVIWIAPESALGNQLASESLSVDPIAVLPDELHASLPLDEFRTAFAEDWDSAQFKPVAERFFSAMSAALPRATTPVHPAVSRAIKIIRRLDGQRISAHELSAAVGLSKSHFLRLFKANMGTPLRPYLQWVRCQQAFVLVLEGASVTDAAARAGFSDSAHFNRVMRRFFAMNPTDLLRMNHVRFTVSLSGQGEG